ncbi:MAG: cation diffusion facilitator family transporter [Candidatus Bathyarchaeota archaeon]|nr:cation diffusion facilitator family transporter [Candidatus Bathyarchaeum sp.]
MPEREKRVRFAAFLNVAFTILELVGGLWTNSLAILSDALHDFGDSVALLASWLFERGARKSPDTNRTFGYQRLSLFSAIFAASILIGGSIIIIFQAIPRLLNPEAVNATGMVGIAIIGIVFNGTGFFLLKKGESLNEKVLSWHLLEDVLGWVGILAGAIVIYFWKIYILDPIITIGLTVFILYNVTKSLTEAINILLQGVPKHINLEVVKQDLKSIKGVIGIHDIHIWSLEGETDVFTAHVVLDNETLKSPEPTKQTIKKTLQKHHIEHSTIELESKYHCSGMICEERHTNNKPNSAPEK